MADGARALTEGQAAVAAGPWPEAARAAFGRLQTPGLLVDLDRVRANLRRVLGLLDGRVDRWRPHVKTLKIPEVMAELVAVGLTRFKAATTREVACLLGVAPTADVLLAHPLHGPGLERLAGLARGHPRARLSVLCEEPSIAASLPEGLDVFVDVNPGMNRTGIPLDDLARILDLARAAGGRFRGVHAYEGHVAGTFDERRAQAEPIYRRLVTLVERLGRECCAVEELVTSGTPGFAPALAFEGFAALPGARHRVSPGTVVYHDLRSATTVEELDLQPAALVCARVVSRPAADIATCDAGSKSLAAETGDPCAVVLGRPDLRPLRPSEEHLPLRIFGGAAAPRPGELLLLVPAHVCPTVNLADRVLLVDGPRVLGTVPVAARAHELDRS